MVKKIICLFLGVVVLSGCDPCPDGETVLKASFPVEYEPVFTAVPVQVAATTGNGMSEVFNASTVVNEQRVDDDGDDCIETFGKSRIISYRSELYNYQLTLALEHEGQKLMMKFSDALHPGYYYSTQDMIYEINLLDANDKGGYKRNAGWSWGSTVSSPFIFHQTFLSNGKSYSNVYELPLYQNPEKNLIHINRVWVSAKEGIVQFSTTAGITWYLSAR